MSAGGGTYPRSQRPPRDAPPRGVPEERKRVTRSILVRGSILQEEYGPELPLQAARKWGGRLHVYFSTPSRGFERNAPQRRRPLSGGSVRALRLRGSGGGTDEVARRIPLVTDAMVSVPPAGMPPCDTRSRNPPLLALASRRVLPWRWYPAAAPGRDGWIDRLTHPDQRANAGAQTWHGHSGDRRKALDGSTHRGER